MKKLSLVAAGLLIAGTVSVFAANNINSNSVSNSTGYAGGGSHQGGEVNIDTVINDTKVTGESTIADSDVGTRVTANGGKVNIHQVINETNVDSAEVSGGSAVGLKVVGSNGGSVNVEKVINETNLKDSAVTDGGEVGMAIE
ncbi:hypothetical protein MNB_SV-12-381 [hydrothermal vent metagenome]|uniref:Uncharacterized protein n=1 Tax=hydrothermal vent metagenome TaxID=652676 RepID=A0A1W1CC30_9ZZZZ